MRDDQLADEGWVPSVLDTAWTCPKCGAMVPKAACEGHMKWHLANSIGFG